MYKHSQVNLSRPLCSVSLGSMTQAIKARRLLSSQGLEVKVRKISEGNSHRGCVYGIEYPCEISGNIRSVLRSNGIDAVLN